MSQNLMKMEKEKLPEFIKNSPILDENSKYVYLPPYILDIISEEDFSEEVNNIEDYKKLLLILSYFSIEIPKSLKKFESDPENENLILQHLWSNYDDSFFKIHLENFTKNPKFIFNIHCDKKIYIYLIIEDKYIKTSLSLYNDKDMSFFSVLSDNLEKYNLGKKCGDIDLFRDSEVIICIESNHNLIIELMTYDNSTYILLKDGSDGKNRFLKLLKKVCDKLRNMKLSEGKKIIYEG